VAQLAQSALGRRIDRRADRYVREASESLSDLKTLSSAACEESVNWLQTLASWHLYATLTYDPARSGYPSGDDAGPRTEPSHQAVSGHFTRFIRQVRTELDSEVSAVAAIEAHKSGWPHIHALVHMDRCDKDAFIRASRLWFDDHGYARFARVGGQDARALSAYIAKYLTKDRSDLLFCGPFPRERHQHQTPLITVT
jgi:hypothetical protein